MGEHTANFAICMASRCSKPEPTVSACEPTACQSRDARGMDMLARVRAHVRVRVPMCACACACACTARACLSRKHSWMTVSTARTCKGLLQRRVGVQRGVRG